MSNPNILMREMFEHPFFDPLSILLNVDDKYHEALVWWYSGKFTVDGGKFIARFGDMVRWHMDRKLKVDKLK